MKMRILKFIVDKQIITPDPKCDFSGLVPGTNGYLKAEFIFSEEWKECSKAAIFSVLRDEYPVSLKNNACIIPEEALKGKKFKVTVVGVKGEEYRIITNKAEVRQNG